MYRAFSVWKRLGEDEVLAYACIEDLSTGRFCVQQSEFFHGRPLAERQKRTVEALANFVELLMDEDPGARAGWFASVVEAIEDHDRSFR